MKKKFQKLLLISLVILLFSAELIADTSQFAIGVGYPYFLVKHSPFEIKYAKGEGINVFAGRVYVDFYHNTEIRAFTGVEGGYIKFNALDTKGSGYEASIFIGGEYFILERLSVTADIAPTYIGLKSEDSFKANGFEIVSNVGLNYYFSKRD